MDLRRPEEGNLASRLFQIIIWSVIILYNCIVCFDFETTSLDKNTCEVWQIGAMAIRPRDLKVYDTHFNIKMQVLEPEKANPESLAQSRTNIEEVMASEILPDEGWHQFAAWVAQFNLGGKSDTFSAPVPAGHNIAMYDIPIYERYCYKYGTTKWDKKAGKDVPGIFNGFRHYDTLQMVGAWVENMKDPRSLSLVNLRKYFGMPQESIDNAHDALQDVRDTAAILCRFLRWQRKLAAKAQFEGCFAREESHHA